MSDLQVASSKEFPKEITQKNIISATITKDRGIKGVRKAHSVTHYKNYVGLLFVSLKLKYMLMFNCLTKLN